MTFVESLLDASIGDSPPYMTLDSVGCGLSSLSSHPRGVVSLSAKLSYLD